MSATNRFGVRRGRGRGRGQPHGSIDSHATASPSGAPDLTGTANYYRGRDRGGFRGGRGRGLPGVVLSGDTVFGGPPSVDQRLASSSELVRTLKTIPYDPERPTRPGFGTLGKPGVLRTNFFPVKFPKTGVIYDYHVEISPRPGLVRSVKTRLFALLEQSVHPGWQEELPQPLKIPVVLLPEGQTQPGQHGRTYTLSIAITQVLSFRELDPFINGQPSYRSFDFSPIVSAYNLVLQHHASHNGVRVGHSRYFFPSSPAQTMNLPRGIEAWKGFFMSARPVYKELMVNVGICMSAFYKAGNLAQAIMEFQQRSNGAMLQRFARCVKVTTSYLGYQQTKVLRRFTSTTARTTSFQCYALDATVTVEEYFQQIYNITLRYPHLPVVDIGANHPIYVAPELCEILPGQPFRGLLDDEQAAQMLRHACKRPAENAHAILNRGIPQLGLTPNNQKLTNFGLEVSPNMAAVPFRELPPPGVHYRSGRPANMNNGSWNILNVKFYLGGVVKSWWILVVSDQRPVFNGPDDPQLISLGKGFAEKCQRSGIIGINSNTPPALLNVNLINPAGDPGRQQSLARIRSKIRDNQAQHGSPSFILVILSKRDNYIYPGIKRICDVELGIHTIHMLTHKALQNKHDQYFSNIALKLNTKLGGINHKIDDWSLQWLTKAKTMLVGMDVTHLGPGSIEGTPSIAAVVASVDDDFIQFPVSLRLQGAKLELITELTEMMIERLERYQEVSKCLPDRVYVFRSSISETHFNQLLLIELPQILEAFGKVSPRGGPQGKPYRPQLTIIACGKRRNVRMWPPDALADRNGNPHPGTVVDQGITTIFGFDFYLQACTGPQGQAKPTHYTVLYDESKLGADEVQQGINTASYLYACATKVVSFIPPVCYANLACKRSRCYIRNFLISESMATTLEGDRGENALRVFDAVKREWGNGIHPNLAGSMFYI